MGRRDMTILVELIDYENRLAACGDWLSHGRIESAFEAGFMIAKEFKKIVT